MENFNYNNNDLIRTYIYQNTLSQGINIKDSDKTNAFEVYANKLKKIYSSNALLLSILSSNIMIVSFCDAYSILNMKIQLCEATNEEKELFNLIRNMITFENLIDGLNDVPDLLERLLPYSIKFYEMDYLKKVLCMHSLSDFTLRTLAVNYPTFENDITSYVDKLSLDTLASYSKEILEEESQESIVEEDMESIIVDSLVGFFKSLAGNDFVMYEELVLDLIRLDYKWNKYFKDLKIKIQIEDEIDIKNRIQMYETNHLSDLVYSEFLINESYQYQIISSFLAIKCYNMGIDPRYINEEIIDKHFDNARGRKLLK